MTGINQNIGRMIEETELLVDKQDDFRRKIAETKGEISSKQITG